MRPAVGIVCIVGALLAAPFLAVADVTVQNIRFYGAGPGEGHVYVDDRKLFVRAWERFEFHEYDPLYGAGPELLDVVAGIRNDGKATEAVDVTLVVSLKLVRIVGGHPFRHDVEAGRPRASWSAPVQRVTKRVTLPSGRSQDVSFEMKLADLIARYWRQDLWPAELRAEVSVGPASRDRHRDGATLARVLRIDPPGY